MLMNQMLEGKKARAAGRLARVSFSFQNNFGAASGAESRDLPLASPGGYCYRPREGQELAVLDTEDGAVCVGTLTDAKSLAPGEITISGPAGSLIYFRGDGAVVINGKEFPPGSR